MRDGEHRALVQIAIRVKKKKKILEGLNVMKLMLAVWSCRKIVLQQF